MTQPGETTEQALLHHAERQTELLSQINWLLWVFAGFGLLGLVVLLLTVVQS